MQSLPLSHIIYISTMLCVKDVASLLSTCHQYFALVNRNFLWRLLLHRDQGAPLTKEMLELADHCARHVYQTQVLPAGFLQQLHGDDDNHIWVTKGNSQWFPTFAKAYDGVYKCVFSSTTNACQPQLRDPSSFATEILADQAEANDTPSVNILIAGPAATEYLACISSAPLSHADIVVRAGLVVDKVPVAACFRLQESKDIDGIIFAFAAGDSLSDETINALAASRPMTPLLLAPVLTEMEGRENVDSSCRIRQQVHLSTRTSSLPLVFLAPLCVRATHFNCVPATVKIVRHALLNSPVQSPKFQTKIDMALDYHAARKRRMRRGRRQSGHPPNRCQICSVM